MKRWLWVFMIFLFSSCYITYKNHRDVNGEYHRDHDFSWGVLHNDSMWHIRKRADRRNKTVTTVNIDSTVKQTIVHDTVIKYIEPYPSYPSYKTTPKKKKTN